MASRREDDGPQEENTVVPWVSAIIFALFMAGLILALYFVVPKLQGYWANIGIAPPLYGRVLIAMSRNLPGVVLAGLVLVGLAFRPRK